MSYKIGMISLGCAKNLINSEQMLWLLSEAGHEIVPDVHGADAVIINTCGFIDSAKSEAIDNILDMAELKKSGELKKIIVTGCLPQRYQKEILEELPEIDAVVGVGNYDDIVSVVERVMADESFELFGPNTLPVEETGRVLSTGPAWAYIKIAEGCDNCCAFCVIPRIRGRYRSRPLENIVDEARSLAEQGVKELIVIAQDITRYGSDIYGKNSLSRLIRALAEIDGIHWIRLHYLYPDALDDELIDTIAAEPKVVKYLDIPIQHINSTILKRMNRRGDGELIRSLFKKLRERIPGLVLRTSLIAGLPGEGEAEFEELCQFLREARIERAGVFPFSPEEGTAAAKMPDIPDADIAQRRAELIMELQADIMDEFYESQLGKTIEVLCEDYDEEAEAWCGRSWADSPDIDGIVYFRGDCAPGEFAQVEITDIIEGNLCGIIAEEEN
ncbi:MAG: 30S ribosomal protein S12 methylthiotransferase RimO [Candidatus Heteroscillospira sp.]|jgi:ribosomal protein S12 methylthiotransferase